jgi:hypothetical protein
MEKWQRVYPDSVTARVADGTARLGYGWAARGFGYANTVSVEASKILADSTEKALTLAQKAPANPLDDCPERYLLLLKIGKTKGWDRGIFISALDAAIKYEPMYHGYYAQTRDYLQPRWYGKEDEWLSFVDTADVLAMNAGSRELYVRLISSVWPSTWQNFNNTTITWGKMRKGFSDLEQNYPNSPFNLNNFARFACLAKDKDVAKKLFTKIGDEPYMELWQNIKEIDFDACRTWALGDDRKNYKSLRDIYALGTYQEAIQERQLAEDGDAVSQYFVGTKYRQGAWGKRDYSKAVKLIKSAAEKGYAPAQVSLGDMYSNGEGINKNDHEAVAWYQRAAYQNDENGKLLLELAYEQGKGTTKNLVKAFAWLSNLNNTAGIGSIDTIWKNLSMEEQARARKETLEIKNTLMNNICN